MHFKLFALLFAVVYLILVTVTSANPIDIDENELPICPEGLIDGVTIYPNEVRCAMVGGICVERDKCAKGGLVSASGLCPRNQANGVECCFELQQQYFPCRKP